jgi:hypothetical protein
MTPTSGITQLCAYCGRPVLNGAAVMGRSGEIYHYWCTRSPYEPKPKQEKLPSVKALEKMK